MKPFFLMLLAATGGFAAEKPRIFLTDRDPVQVTGEAQTGDVKNTVAVTRSASSTQEVAVMNAFLERCPGVVVTTNREKADYIVRVNYDEPNPTTWFVRSNKIAVFDRTDEMFYGTSARLLRNAVKDACLAIVSTSSTKSGAVAPPKSGK